MVEIIYDVFMSDKFNVSYETAFCTVENDQVYLELFASWSLIFRLVENSRFWGCQKSTLKSIFSASKVDKN